MADHAPVEMSEERAKLWLVAAAPLIWAAHFMVSYVAASVWCAKVAGHFGSLEAVRWFIAGVTALALLGIAVCAQRGWRHHQVSDTGTPHDDDTPEDRHAFMGFAALLLSGLSAVATLFVAATVIFIGDCR